MVNDLLLDEREMQRKLETAIVKAFKDGVTGDTDYYYNLFGKQEFRFYSSINSQNTIDSKYHFPCGVITLDSTPVSYARNSRQIEEVSRVEFEIEVYNVKVPTMDKEQLGQKINYVIKKTLQTVFDIALTTNTPLRSPDNTIYRRLLSGVFFYNNKTQTFYKGE